MTEQVHATALIKNTPDAVLGYIADVNNRTFFLPSLKSITNVQGSPAGADTTWDWSWVLLGVEFHGTGSSLNYEPGKTYSIKTEGGIESTWTYEVTPEGSDTRLKISVDYQPPQSVIAKLKSGHHQSEVDLVIQNLKTILDQ